MSNNVFKNSVYRLLVYSLCFSFLTGFTVGDDIQLQQSYNGRSSMNFYGRRNIALNVRRGSTAKVLQVRSLNSGNYGIQVQLGSEYQNRTVWIYDWKNRTDDIALCTDSSCSQTTESRAEAAYARAEQDQDAYRDIDAADRDITGASEAAFNESCTDCVGSNSGNLEDVNTILVTARRIQEDNMMCAIPARPENPELTSGYSRSRRDPLNPRRHRPHTGIDFRGREGEPVFAAMDGIVRLGRCGGGYGNCVEIEHNTDGFRGFTRYAHMPNRNCRALSNLRNGMRVARGEQIGCVGRTGRVTGPHLHFEVRNSSGAPINPVNFCGFDEVL